MFDKYSNIDIYCSICSTIICSTTNIYTYNNNDINLIDKDN